MSARRRDGEDPPDPCRCTRRNDPHLGGLNYDFVEEFICKRWGMITIDTRKDALMALLHRGFHVELCERMDPDIPSECIFELFIALICFVEDCILHFIKSNSNKQKMKRIRGVFKVQESRSRV
jgi:hypothetical protein